MPNPLDFLIKDPAAMRYELMREQPMKKGGAAKKKDAMGGVAGEQKEVRMPPGGPMKNLTWDDYRHAIGMRAGGYAAGGQVKTDQQTTDAMKLWLAVGGAVSDNAENERRTALAYSERAVPQVDTAGELIRVKPDAEMRATPSPEEQLMNDLRARQAFMKDFPARLGELATGSSMGVPPYLGELGGVAGLGGREIPNIGLTTKDVSPKLFGGKITRPELEKLDFDLNTLLMPGDVVINADRLIAAKPAFSKLPTDKDITTAELFSILKDKNGNYPALEGVTRLLGYKGHQIPSTREEPYFKILPEQKAAGGAVKPRGVVSAAEEPYNLDEMRHALVRQR